MMSGQAAFDQLLRQIREVKTQSIHKKITRREFDEWNKQVSLDILKGVRYGQSFCNYFGITDNILYYEFSWINAEEYIQRAYVE